MDSVLTYLDSADRLLDSFPTRARIARTPKLPVRSSFKIRVDRTMPFEFISNLMPPFCGLWGADIRFEVSDYDAALSQLGGDLQADAYLIWLDWRVYRKSMTPQAAASWLMNRIQHLRGGTNKTILVNNWPVSAADGDHLFGFRINATERGWIRKLNSCLFDHLEHAAGCELVDLEGLAQERASSFFDDRNEAISHYPFSDQATIVMARHLGVHLFPAVFLPRLKAIALDLDDTLYNGVLGEEGSDGITLSEGHIALQQLLLELKRSGILLTICSRNEEKDVKALFDSRDDFPLKWTDFAAVSANWQPKAENLNRLAQLLNIDPSAMLFVDDNPAELLKTASVLPEIRLLRADRDGMLTRNKISHYPGLYLNHPDGEAASRTRDIQAKQQREIIRENASDYNKYLESLKMTVRIYGNEPSHSGRLYELSRKTNQFNLAMRRMTEMEAQDAMDSGKYVTLTVHLADILSESGIIGAFVCRLEGRNARLIETLFSCRALGREVETVAFACLLEKLTAAGIEQISIDVTVGTRNSPAIDWLRRFVSDSTDNLSLAELLSEVRSACMNHPARVEVIE
ncbi:HAD-IIIC family phosphatase [Cohnella cholangitidis]|uniref:HAD-IIIC family phosphatase n=1 Tax=Cohnella cholangitidis TaxID=2598458 RepID=A0A7G5BV20_9BACL|nr:HAD-IIIC family phosphatase [Cohnella cholangitidis]QMV40804.1 HAD-IIIC family phosphatase [Cohnella cholangitidis]